MKTCYNCKKEVPEDSIYCMYCAAPLNGKEVTKQVKEQLDGFKRVTGDKTDNEAVKHLLSYWYDNLNDEKKERYAKIEREDKQQELSNQAK